MLNRKVQARLHVGSSILEYLVPIVQAAEQLGASSRRSGRCWPACREDGVTVLAHGKRGRRPHDSTDGAENGTVEQLETERREVSNHIDLTELRSEEVAAMTDPRVAKSDQGTRRGRRLGTGAPTRKTRHP